MVVLFKIRGTCAGVRATSVEVSGHLPAGSKEAAAHLTFTQKQACLQDGEDGAELEKACYIPNEAKRNGGEAKERGKSCLNKGKALLSCCAIREESITNAPAGFPHRY
jgi:hypothetical protein